METSPLRKSDAKPLPRSPLCSPTRLKLAAGGVDEAAGSQIAPDVMKSKKWTITDFDIGRKLGKGSFGAVYIARERESRFVLALKILYKSCFVTEESMQQQMREINIHFHLRHPNIVQLYSYFYDHKRIYLMLEFVSKGNLEDELNKFQYFTVCRAATYVYQLTSAIDYIHTKKIIHRDIKAANCLVGSKGEIKLIDFGQSIHKPSSKSNRFVGTIDYLPPEVAFCQEDLSKNQPYDHAVDIWSLGILTYFMLTGALPFAKLDAPSTLKCIQQGKIELPRDRLSRDSASIIEEMLQVDPKARLTSKQVLEHFWVRTNAEKSFISCKAALYDWDSLQHNAGPHGLSQMDATFGFNSSNSCSFSSSINTSSVSYNSSN